MRASNSLWTVGALLSGVTNSVQKAIPEANLVDRHEIVPPTQTVTIPGSVTTVSGGRIRQTLTTTISSEPVVTTKVTAFPPYPVLIPGTTTVVPPISKVTLCPEPTGVSQKSLRTEDVSPLGCKAGLVCNPPKPERCNLWPGVPPSDFACAPEDCIPVPGTHNEVFWDGDEISYYSPAWGYFNLDPEPFGLTYEIFEYSSGDKTKRTTKSGHFVRKRQGDPGDTPIPDICFDSCNAAYQIISNSVWTREQCLNGSEYMRHYGECANCLADFPIGGIEKYLAAVFTDFANYCLNPTTPTTSTVSGPDTVGPSISITTVPGGSPSSPSFTPITTTSEPSTSSSSASTNSITQPPPDTSSTTSVITSTSTSAETQPPTTTPETLPPTTTSGSLPPSSNESTSPSTSEGAPTSGTLSTYSSASVESSSTGSPGSPSSGSSEPSSASSPESPSTSFSVVPPTSSAETPGSSESSSSTSASDSATAGGSPSDTAAPPTDTASAGPSGTAGAPIPSGTPGSPSEGGSSPTEGSGSNPTFIGGPGTPLTTPGTVTIPAQPTGAPSSTPGTLPPSAGTHLTTSATLLATTLFFLALFV